MRFILMLVAALAFSQSAMAEETALEREKRLSAEFLAAVAMEPGAEVLEGGVVIRPLFDSDSGIYAGPNDTISVGYFLSDRTGKLLEETFSGDEVPAFPLNSLIRCWQIAVPKIAKDSYYKVSCPSDTAYGDAGAGEGLIPGGAALSFRIQLFNISRATE